MTQRNTPSAGSNAPDDDLPSEPPVGRLALPPVATPFEAALSVHHERARFADAALRILRRYASEVRAFLRVRTSSRASMEEIYSVFSEDVWKGLPRVRAGGHMRGWIYVLARNALARHVRLKQRWRNRHVFADLDALPLDLRRSVATELSHIARLEPLLAELDSADRLLLEQRLVLSMAWREIATEHARAMGLTTAAEVTRVSARLRKRYQLLLQQLRERAAATRDTE
jgi:DNA-directed RNA polymerase specialized sigma24 family protein